MIEKILERLEAERAQAEDETCRLFSGDYALPCSFDRTDIEKTTMETMAKAIEIVQEVAKDGGWIPCSERLPKNHERILCMHSSGFIDCGDFICESWCCDMDEYSIKKDEVIAWQPLPAPYQKGV